MDYYANTGVCSSFIDNCQNLKATKMSLSRWMDKETVVYPDNGILFRPREEWAIKLWKTRRKHSYILLSERSLSEKAACCLTSTTWHSGKSKTTETVKRPVVASDWGEGRMNRQSTENFRAVKLLWLRLQWWIQLIKHLPKSWECTTPNPNLWTSGDDDA